MIRELARRCGAGERRTACGAGGAPPRRCRPTRRSPGWWRGRTRGTGPGPRTARHTALAFSICSMAGPVVPTGKNRSGSVSRQRATSRQSSRSMVSCRVRCWTRATRFLRGGYRGHEEFVTSFTCRHVTMNTCENVCGCVGHGSPDALTPASTFCCIEGDICHARDRAPWSFCSVRREHPGCLPRGRGPGGRRRGARRPAHRRRPPGRPPRRHAGRRHGWSWTRPSPTCRPRSPTSAHALDACAPLRS